MMLSSRPQSPEPSPSLEGLRSNAPVPVIRETRHWGYDNCKLVFMLLVVLWHTSHLGVMEPTLTWGSSDESSSGGAITTEEASFWDRATNKQLFHHPGWTPFVTHMVMRYWLWTEKVAVPGFSFLSGYFGKGFLPKKRPAEYSLYEMQQDERKNRLRWEKTIQTLVIAPLLWQALQGLLSLLAHGIYTGQWSLSNAISPQLDIWNHLGTWYLFALLLWRMMTSLFLSRLRQDRNVPFIISMGLALLSTHTSRSGVQEMQQRIFFFFPYYVAGLYCNEGTWHWLIAGFSRLFKCSDNNKVRTSRLMGCCGMLTTLFICQIAPRDTLGWQYSIDNFSWRAHLVFFMQYLLAGSAVASVILFINTFQSPLFPFSHGGSTLAIYEWHWPFANLLAWGHVPFTTVVISNTSFIEFLFSRLSPVPAVLAAHAMCYVVCVVLGSKVLWDFVLQHLCDPQWATKQILNIAEPKLLPL